MQDWLESFWAHHFADTQIYAWELLIEDWFFVFAMGFLALELVRLLIKKQMDWATLGDVAANFVTLATHLGIIALSAGLYLLVMYSVYDALALTYLPNNGWTIALAILLADFAYYWEHRAAHRIGLGWATHTVHHSSPYFNISVAYRHGPLDALFGLPFLLPLVILGFDPILILFAAAMVQLFQTMLHTETIGKLPAFIEAIFNTPSHHRVHHGANKAYIDKNYAGILIIWDKMFGTFTPEKDKVIYGVRPAIESVNPLVVFGHGFYRLVKKMRAVNGLGNKLACLIQPPGWTPRSSDPSKDHKSSKL
ncbi:MAG: sterol desaturase family protein [Cohaesibacter sp.]|nr:sterol desaturase family protein [Cohaesibacter sp.]